MNKLTLLINIKGYSLKEFLIYINRTDEWFYKHSVVGSKDYNMLTLAIKGVKNHESV